MAYDDMVVITYSWGEIDFGAGSDAVAIKGYGGKKGKILDIGVSVTETFNQVTTPAYIRMGTTGDADAYAELNMAAAADTDYYNILDDTDAIIAAAVPADTQIEVAFITPTGGTPAGKGHVNITIGWF
tara:strand:+ start:33 stop:416 length:384 start_codon:yes stop_codon:yes gene_type:complete